MMEKRRRRKDKISEGSELFTLDIYSYCCDDCVYGVNNHKSS